MYHIKKISDRGYGYKTWDGEIGELSVDEAEDYLGTKIIKKGTFSPVLKYIALFTIVLGGGFFYFLISSGFTFTLENSPYLIGFGGGFVLCVLLWIFHLFGKAPSTNIIIVGNNSKE